MSACKTVRIKPTEQIQCPGHDFVEINETDYDANIHELYEADDGDGMTKAGNQRGAHHNARASKAATPA